MRLHFTANDNFDEVRDVVDGAVYQTIAEVITSLTAPNKVIVQTPVGDAAFQLIPSAGAFFVREEFNHLPAHLTETCKPIYLVCINPEHNSYKFYKLEDCGGNEIKATYGRIGVSSGEIFGERTHFYPKRMYFIKVLEKLNKGYKDMTAIYLPETKVDPESTDTKETEEEVDTTTFSYQLFDMLKKYSNHIVEKTCISTKVTSEMVSETKKLLLELYQVSDDVDTFNDILLKILAISPRRVYKVQELLAKSTSDFEKIISREEALVMAMEGVVLSNKPQARKTAHKDFSSYDIKVYEATDKQKEEVLKHLSPRLQGKVKNIYRVISKEQKDRFNAYLETNNIKKVKQLWHGSKNCNWLSIIVHGLQLHPNAAITGKMFGDGCYFAPSCEKAWNYTSYYGTYWARGRDDKGFMGLYACAYGKPLDVTTCGRYDQRQLNAIGKNCVHAHAGTQLRNDEIIFYDEAAMLLNYIVEFE